MYRIIQYQIYGQITHIVKESLCNQFQLRRVMRSISAVVYEHNYLSTFAEQVKWTHRPSMCFFKTLASLCPFKQVLGVHMFRMVGLAPSGTAQQTHIGFTSIMPSYTEAL